MTASKRPPVTPDRFTREAVLCAALLLALLASGGCEKRRSQEAREEPAPATSPRPAHPEPEVSEPAVPSTSASDTIAPAEPGALRYRRVPVTGPRMLFAIRDSLGPAGFFEILKLNRLDLPHIRQGDSLVVSGIAPDTLRLSPFPQEIAPARGLSKLLLVSIRVQSFAAYQSGRLVRWGPTSSGRQETPTPPRLYHTNWKDKERVSTFNDEWKLTWYVNLDNSLGISLHQYELPGRPASHSCIRLLEEDARWLYGWSEQWKLTPDGRGIVSEGTPVVIFGEYDYSGRPPWKRLPENPDAATVTAEEISGALRALAAPAPEPLSNR